MPVEKSKRVAFTWDQEYKPYKDEIKLELKGLGSVNANGELTETELFLLCLVFGVRHSNRRDVPARKSDGPRLEYVNDRQLALIKSVALSESENSDVLLKEDELFDIAESLAAGGLELLAQARTTQRDFKQWIQIQCIDLVGK